MVDAAVVARILLIAAALPVSILANSLRVMMMAMGSVWFGLGWINTGLHDVPAYLSVPLGCLLYLGVHLLIGMFTKNPTVPIAPTSNSSGELGFEQRSRSCWITAGTMACVLVLTIVLKFHITATAAESYTSMRSPVEKYGRMKSWSGDNRVLD